MKIVGNVIVFDGQVVASINDGILPSLKGRFEVEVEELSAAKNAAKSYETRYVQLVDGLVSPDSLDCVLKLIDDMLYMKTKKERIETIDQIKAQIDEVQHNLAYCFDLNNSFDK